jgi:hypothetical protein
MAGINRALSLNESRAKTNFSTSVKCVFISHQKDDTIYCKKIANYLMDSRDHSQSPMEPILKIMF